MTLHPILPTPSARPLAAALLVFFAPLASGQGGAPPSEDALRMGSPPTLADGLSEEVMWPAADAEGWRKPCLVPWQRTFEDALRVARAEQRPILVAVNMDGEIASEHFAGVRYRDPETAALMSRYACVMASVYRHTPRDYDVDGTRIECPRFQTVTCGEHIEAERELYERYFDGKRIAPRHIVLGLDESETYDVYFSWDTASVFTTFRKGLEGWEDPIEPLERTLFELAASADVEDREAVERAYREGDTETRRALLEFLIEERVVDQVEVLREAIFGFDLELARLARHALARCESEAALELMADVLKSPLEADERELLLAAVDRLGGSLPRARALAALHDGFSRGSRHVDAAALEAVAREYEANAEKTDLQARAERAEARPDDPDGLLELAEALVTRARESRDRRFAHLLLEDASSATSDAEELGVRGPGVDAVAALAAAGLGDRAAARMRAVAAVEGGLLHSGDGAARPGSELSETSRREVLHLFAEARRAAIRDAYRVGGDFPPEWLSDVNAAYSVLSQGPLADERILVQHHDFLRWVGATPQAVAALDDALLRFPDSPVLHERLRGELLWEGGPRLLEASYAERLARAEAESDAGASGAGQLAWFAGYASLVAAEHHRRRAQLDEALAAYDHASAYYERHVERFPEARDDGLHYLALAHAGRARVALERGEMEQATRELVAALRTRPASAASQDGLGITPVATAKMLAARLREAGDDERAALVQSELDALDPELLEPPPSEPPRLDRRARR